MSDTTAGISELIARIKADGVQAGEHERQQIVAGAQAEAARLLAAAREEAAAIEARARQEAEAVRGQLRSELRMATRDFVLALGEQLRAQVIDVAVREDVAEQMRKADVLQHIISEVVGTLAADRDVDVVVSDEVRDVLAGSAWRRIVARARAGIELRGERRMSGFRLEVRGEHVVWDFSDHAIAAALSGFVAPKLRGFFDLDNVIERARSGR